MFLTRLVKSVVQLIKEQVSADQIFLLAHQWHDASCSTWQMPEGKDPSRYLPLTELRATSDTINPETQVLGLLHSWETTLI